MISLRLDKELEQRLNILAKETGRTKTFYVREAIKDKLEELEDIYLSEQVLNRIKAGKEHLVDNEEFWNDLDN